ncbi:hypothetical protein [Cytobacillus oceanisediminis]|uniref:hypothetical protein n=1 Tax=Cytobacillus oceanisediminis TaxID=665099 RepID=UPI001FB2C996|nr:hypothetical protein [Cytobacillus oceanisediminis]UOE58189.1 hypothetical protein IRB79_27180 [Cytobacillus oceanisediminis]
MPKEEKDKNQEVFDQAFGSLLNTEPENNIEQEPETPLEEALFGPPEEHVPLTEKEWAAAAENYIPPSVSDEHWEQFAARPPIPPLDREQEARAVQLGLQELRKMKEYTHYIYQHMTKEFKAIYVTYPLLLEGKYEDVYAGAHKDIMDTIEDLEHLIAGDIDAVQAVKNDFKLFQQFEEQRLSLLYKIIDFYNKKLL